jgi:hypothetical protein
VDEAVDGDEDFEWGEADDVDGDGDGREDDVDRYFREEAERDKVERQRLDDLHLREYLEEEAERALHLREYLEAERAAAAMASAAEHSVA